MQTITKPNRSAAFQLMVSMKWKRWELRHKNCNLRKKIFQIFPPPVTPNTEMMQGGLSPTLGKTVLLLFTVAVTTRWD